MSRILTLCIVMLSICNTANPSVAKIPGGPLCDKLVGMWQGSHTYKDSSSSTYRAIHHRNGLLEVYFTNTDKNGSVSKERHLGQWKCDQSTFETLIVNGSGDRIEYKYKILHIDDFTVEYQNYLGEKLGPIFEAKKVSN